MPTINKVATLNPFTDLIANVTEYVPRATTSTFGVVAIGSGINVDSLGRIYLDTQEYSDRLAAIEAEAATTLATQKSEVAAAIAQVNLTQSQTITALTLEVSNLKTNLTDSITATQTDLINRADQLAQNITDISDQLTQDKATFTQEIQDALVYLKDEASVATALRTPRKIQTVPFDGTQDINLPVFTSEIDGLVPKREGTTTTKYLREDGTWEVPPDTTYPLLTKAKAEAGTATTANTISAKVLKDAILHHTPIVTDITGNAGTAAKLQTPRTIGDVTFDGTANINLPGVNIAGNQDTSGNAATATKLATARTINGVDFDGTQDITLPLASTSVSGTVQLNNTLTSTATDQALTAAQGKALNDNKLYKTENAVSASKLQTSRTISLTGGVTGSVSFDGSEDASIATTITGLGAANGIATLDSSGQVPSTQLPSYVDDVLEYQNVAAFPPTGETGKIYVETTGNTTYRWSGTGYVKITSGEVASVAGKTGVVTLTKTDVGLPNVDNTADSAKSVATATKLTTARTIGGISFDGSANINLPGVNTPGNQSTSGNAGSATKLETARTLTVGNTGKTFDGSANVGWTVAEVLPTAASGQFLKFDGTDWIATTADNITYSTMSQVEADTGTDTSNRVITAAVLKSAIQTHAPVQTSVAGNAGTATKLATPRIIALIGDGAGYANFDGSSHVSINLTLNDLNNSAGTYGANNLEIPTFTLNKKGLLTSAGNRAFPYSGVGQYGAAILYNGLDSYSTSHSATANIVRHLNAVKVDINKSFNDAFGSDVDHYINAGNLKGFTSCADFPVGSRMIVDSPALPDMPNLGSAAIYFETKRTYVHPGRLQIAYGYNNGRTATRSAAAGAAYSDWVYTASLDSNIASATKLQTARTIGITGWSFDNVSASFDGTSNININISPKYIAYTANAISNFRLEATGSTSLGTFINVGRSEVFIPDFVDAYSPAINFGTSDTHAYISPSYSTKRVRVGAGHAGKLNWTGELAFVDGNIATATKLQTARTINGVTFDGTTNITVEDSTKVPLSGGTVSGNLNARALGVNSTDGSGVGLSLYGGAVSGLPNYGIAFAHSSNFGGHGYVSGDEWATYFTMTGGASRGWIFRSFDYGNVASISAQGNTQFNGSIVAGGNITAFSDARLKDNITKIPDALNKLNQLKGVTYTRKDLATDTQYAGLIAQDVQKVLPEAVAITKDDTLAVDYNGVIGLLVEAVKELEAKVAILEGK